MRILIIDEEFPFPLNTGKRLRTFNLTVELAKSNQVDYFAFGAEESEAARHLKANGVTPYAVSPPDRRQSGPAFYFKLLLNLVSRDPYIVTSHYRKNFQEKMLKLLQQNKYDVIVVEWTPYASYVRGLAAPRKIIVAHNIESTIWKRYAENESNVLKRWYMGVQYKKVVAFERDCFHWANGATAVTDEEAAFIKNLGVPFQPEVIDNGVDTDYFHPFKTSVDDNCLVFTGSMDWRPNQDAAIYFVQEIFPLLRKDRPDIRAVFVGRNPPRHIAALGKIDGITITGTVDDVRGYIAQAAVYIVPLRIGGGSRLKILEALAMQKAVVSTSVGAEGLNVTNNEDIIITDGAENFATKVLDCLKSDPLKERLGVNGRLLVLRRYRWSLLAEKLNKYLKKAAEVE